MKNKLVSVICKGFVVVLLILILCISLAIIFFEIGCLFRLIGANYSLSGEIGRTWVSDSGEVEFQITEFSGGYGTITIEGEVHEMEVSVITSMKMLYMRENSEGEEEDNRIEGWEILEQKRELVNFKIQEVIVIKVSESVYFEEGEIIAFYRTD